MTSSKGMKKLAGKEAPADQVDVKLFKALRHPLRVRILKVLNERASSPTKLADELNENLGNVSYHGKGAREVGSDRTRRHRAAERCN